MAAPQWDSPFDETVFRDLRNNSNCTSDQAAQADVQGTTPSTSNRALSSTQAASPFALLLPASYRFHNDRGKPHIVTASPEYAKADLSVKRPNDIHSWLWLAGQPMPPRPLSYQRASSREIVLNEDACMHLVWAMPRRIFLKPIPRYLLDCHFWQDNLKTQKGFYGYAFGFLLSYAALIQYESDFRIAKEKHLIPESLTWEAWINFVRQLLHSSVDDRVNIRYHYGELRLSRLNKMLWAHGRLRGYSFPLQTYEEMFTTNSSTNWSGDRVYCIGSDGHASWAGNSPAGGQQRISKGVLWIYCIFNSCISGSFLRHSSATITLFLLQLRSYGEVQTGPRERCAVRQHLSLDVAGSGKPAGGTSGNGKY